MSPDLRQILSSTDRYNFHGHTQFCDGRDTMESIAGQAVAEGFTEFGFTPHGPISVESPCNMSADDVEVYIAEIDRLRCAYPSLRIYSGMEADYIDDEDNPAIARNRYPGLDYLIGSVHFVPTRDGRPVDVDGTPERFVQRLETDFGGDLDYVIDTFWTQTKKMIERGGFEIVGHLDKIALNASFVRPELEMEPAYREKVDEVINLIVGKGYAVEINTKHRRAMGRFFPHPRYWSRLHNAGVLMPVNSDVHYKDRIDESRREAFVLFKAVIALKEPSVTLAVVDTSGHLTLFRNRGITDLWELYSSGENRLKDASVADKVVGKGAAALMIAGGVSQIYAEVISRPALKLFGNYPEIKVDYGTIVDGIVNRRGDGPCPVEALTIGLDDVPHCVEAITRFVKEHKKQDT